MRDEGATLVWVTHDMGVVAELADEVAVVYGGRLAEHGLGRRALRIAAPSVHARAVLETVRAGRDAPPKTPFHAIAGQPPTGALPGGCPFRPRCPVALPPAQPSRRRPRARRRPPRRLPPRRGRRVSALVELRDVHRRFGRVHAVAGVSLALDPGRTVGVVGESGCGKSTLARLVLGLVRPSAGELRFAGARYPSGERGLRRVRRQLGMVFQDPYDALDPRFDVREIVAEPLRAHGRFRASGDARVRGLLEAVGLGGLDLAARPGALSGGQRQRLGVARALALDPELVVCDEPTSALDVSVQAQVLNLLLALQAERGFGFLFISHDLEVVRRMSDEIVVMYAGAVVERGPAAAVTAGPRHPYTRALLDAVPRVEPGGGGGRDGGRAGSAVLVDPPGASRRLVGRAGPPPSRPPSPARPRAAPVRGPLRARRRALPRRGAPARRAAARRRVSRSARAMTPAIRTDLPRATTVLDHVFIPLTDGTRLHARVLLPVDAVERPVPAVLEYLPYRLNDGTVASDHQQMTWFAGHGYAGVRVDIRGSGESDGVLVDEYTAQEQADGLEVIAWLAAQPWCDGAVGMMGYSWSGFNSLQVAALRPPALRAIATCYASDDRYADDVHYRGGLVLPMDMLQWSVCMHGWQARPPDPEVVGERWRALWQERLEQAPWIAHWLAHQRRDAYWRQGSVRDDLSRIACPVLAVAGWADGYSDSALRLLAGLDVPRRAIIGPWGHNDPVHGVPGPAVGILGELVRWWDRWLKGVDSGIDDDPQLIAYCQDWVAPAAVLDERPGRFVGEDAWPSPRIVERVLALGPGTLEPPGAQPAPGVRSIASVQTVGLDGGAWCADGRSADLPLDQRADDARSLTFDSAPLDAPLELLGHVEARLVLAADRPRALVSARLCELRADGTSLLVTRGQLNLCHRRSHAEPEDVPPGEELAVTVQMDGIAHRLAAGSRLRLSVSPCYWPLAWPSPEPVVLALRHGTGAALVLPERPPRSADATLRPLDPPEEPPALPAELVRSGSGGSRSVRRDLGTGRVELVFDWDCGGRSRLANGVEYEDTSVTTYAIEEGRPLTARVDVENTSVFAREGLEIAIAARGTMTCDADDFLVTSTLEVAENGVRAFARTWTHRFPRDHG